MGLVRPEPAEGDSMSERLSAEEFLEEFLWLAEGGVSLMMICEALNMDPLAVSRRLYRYGQSYYASKVLVERNAVYGGTR